MPFDSSLGISSRDQIITASNSSELTNGIFESNKSSNLTVDNGLIYNEEARLFLLANLLTNDRVLTHNGKAFFKELIIRKDQRLSDLLIHFSASKDDIHDDKEGKLLEKDSSSSSVKDISYQKELNQGEKVFSNSFLSELLKIIATCQENLFDALYSDCPLSYAKALSKEERLDKDLNDDKNLIYGEVEFASFHKILRKINADPGSTFYDLGSGSGRAVFIARLTQDFKICRGIEILDSLHITSLELENKYYKYFKEYLNQTMEQDVEFIGGSILDYDWSDGDVIFMNSTCFSDELMEEIALKAETLKPGSFLISFTKGLQSDYFEVLEQKRYLMSWGPATVFIHRRLKEDGSPMGGRMSLAGEKHNELEEDLSAAYQGGPVLYPTYIDDEFSYHTSDEEDSDVDNLEGGHSEKVIEESKQNLKDEEAIPSGNRKASKPIDGEDDTAGDITMEHLLEQAGISTSNSDEELTPEEVKRVVNLLARSNPELESYLHENILSRLSKE